VSHRTNQNKNTNDVACWSFFYNSDSSLSKRSNKK